MSTTISTPPKTEPQTGSSFSSLKLGLALFAMYFGAGNLIFPMIVGHETGANNLYALLGLSFTAVFFPLLGLFAIMLYEGKQKPFFGTLGKRVGFFVFFAIQLIVGPLYITPRLFALMWGNVQSIAPSCPKWLFFSLAIAAIFYCTQKNSRMLQILGLILTPVLIVSLVLLIGIGLYDAPAAQASSLSALDSFQVGFLGGYSTMDLIASFLFASAILPAIADASSHIPKTQRRNFMTREMMKAGLVSGVLLMVSYTGLSFLSAHYTWTLGAGIPHEQWLGKIATNLLGKVGATVASVAILLACLTTAISLISIFSNYLREEVLQSKVPLMPIMIATLLTAAFIGSQDFATIFSKFVPVLKILYPGLILLCFLNIFSTFVTLPKKVAGLLKLPVLLVFANGVWNETGISALVQSWPVYAYIQTLFGFSG